MKMNIGFNDFRMNLVEYNKLPDNIIIIKIKLMIDSQNYEK